ncbi:uncharacterized protein LOC119733962 [Patiria miniata]|uniref:Uncharacterized protein n=1 Tax=Patiria miniata TaxID=46514 RepID=A0A914AHR7_PATMI|nr:uncharacterized protein LOC119733962 [Patiria miniata]
MSLFNARTILQTTKVGTAIVAQLQADKVLTKKARCTMTSLLVGFLIENHGLKPSSYEKQCLAESIIEEFPYLKDPEGKGYEAWYMKGANKRPATGYLEERLRYIRKTMLDKEDRNKGKLDAPAEEPPREGTTSSPEEEARMVAWLKDNMEPASKVQEYMALTARQRKNFIGQKKHSLAGILEEFPRILDKDMIAQDFDLVHHPGIADNLFFKWEGLCDSVIAYANFMTPTWKQVLHMQDKVDGTLSTAEKKNLALFLLPVILGGRSKGKRGGRCSLFDSIDAFIDLKPAIINVDNYLDSINAEKRPQPFILALYTTERLSPSQVFLVVERRAIPYPSLIKTVDAAFKAHYVLDINYQPQVKTVWEFLQNVVYELPGIVPPILRDFRAYLVSK